MQFDDVLSSLIKEKQESWAGIEDRTLFGTRIDCDNDGVYTSDISEIVTFPGLSILLEDLSTAIHDSCFYGNGDIMVNLPLSATRNGALYESGIHTVCFYAPFSSLEDYPLYRETFAGHLRTIFNTMQSKFLLNCLRGEGRDNARARALFFPFDIIAPNDQTGASYLVEYVREASFLRITLDKEDQNRLRLRSIPHRVVSHIDYRAPSNVAANARSLLRGIQNEAYKNTGMFVTDRLQLSTYLDYLNDNGLSEAGSICFYWPERTSQQFMLEDTNRLEHLLHVTLILIGDRTIVEILKNGEPVRLLDHEHCVWIDLSQRQRRLNISFDEPRERISMDYFLQRAPELERFTRNTMGTLSGIRVLMVHHGTAEVIGTAKALSEMGCNGTHTFFIKYAGAMPDSYLDAILAEPVDKYSFHSLQQVSTTNRVEGCYVLSPAYSSLAGMDDLNEHLQKKQLDFGQAMQFVGGHLFLKIALIAAGYGEKLFLVEDGGYLAPMINDLCIQGITLGDALDRFMVDPAGRAPGDYPHTIHQPSDTERAVPLEQWLSALYIGSSEVTRNGHNRIERIEKTYGRLAFPAVSQAISNLKRGIEASETSAAIIHALETILRGQGFILSARHALVLGCRGAIGVNLMKQLTASLSAANVAGVDIVVNPASYRQYGSNSDSPWTERQYINELPRELLHTMDLIVGMVGESILKPDQFSDMLLHSTGEFICLVSGSTKTDEYTDISNWLDELINCNDPKIGGIPVYIRLSLIRDHQTRLIQGKCVTFEFQQCTMNPKPFTRRVFLYAELMPVNFLYYGSPCEIIQQVETQLLRVSLGAIRRHCNGNSLPPKLLSVDHEIDADANPLG